MDWGGGAEGADEAPADVLLMLWVSSNAHGWGGGGTGVAGSEDGDSSRNLAVLWETGCGIRGEKCHNVEQEEGQGYSRCLRSRRWVSWGDNRNGSRENNNSSYTKMVGELFLELSGHDDFCAQLFSVLQICLSSMRNQGGFQDLPREVSRFVLPLLLDFILFFYPPFTFNSIKMPCCSCAHRVVPNTQNRGAPHLFTAVRRSISKYNRWEESQILEGKLSLQ